MLRAVTIAPDDDLLSLPQAARVIGVSPMTLRMWALQGRISARMAGPIMVMRALDVAAYKAERAAAKAAV